MSYILVRLAFLVVMTLALSLLAGCSADVPEDPADQANEYIAEANQAIGEHNRLFQEARSTYDEARKAIEDEEDTSQEAERIAQARQTMQEARDTLEEARSPLEEVQNLAVDPKVEEYARLLSDTLEARLAAEAQEIEFYEITEGDPTLSEDRQRAEDLLTEIDQGYQRAEESYSQAQKLADANPELLGESKTGPQTTTQTRTGGTTPTKSTSGKTGS